MDQSTLRLSVMQSNSALVRKLGTMTLLSKEEAAVLESLQSNIVRLKRGDVFISDGGSLSATFVLRAGWAARSLKTKSGRRQIISVALPGDILGLHASFRRTATYTAEALSELELSAVDPIQFLDVSRRFPLIAAGLSWFTAREFTILGDQTLRLGRLSAHQRIAHFLAEIYSRLEKIEEVEDGLLTIPMTQTDLADTLGLSHIHTNRELRKLRENGLIEVQGRRAVRILDIERLCDVGMFDRDRYPEIALSEPLTGSG